MAGEGLWMSIEERERSHLVRQTQEKHLSQRQASERLGIGVRQFKRLVRSWKQQGDAGLVSRQRGRASNNRLAPGEPERIAALLRDKYPDFGPTLAVEKLLERDGIAVSAETVRQMQIAMGLWRPKKRRHKRVFQLRERRPRFGELIQIDGSPHAWLEDRGPRCTLIVFIDDATSRLTALQFAPSETTRAYLAALRSHVLAHGRPLAFYSDRHGIFRVNAKDAQSGDGKTEFGRVVDRLGITLINALTPQAKGRVERANGTLQDRLVKEMRLSGIDTLAAGNAFLPAFMEKYNARFAKAPFDDRDVHRPLVAKHDDLDDAFAWKEERTVSVNLTLQYDQVLFILEPIGIARSLARKRVTVIDYPDGRLAIRYNGVDLRYRTFDKRPQVNQAAIVENKRLGPILAYIAEQQKQLDMSRSAKAPRRRGQKNHMFKVG